MDFASSPKEQDLNSWEDFCKKINDLYEYWEQLKLSCQKGVTSNLLFRGQPNKDFKLTSTLLRFLQSQEYSAHEYFDKSIAAKYEVETFLNQSWEIPYIEIVNTLNDRAKNQNEFLFNSQNKTWEYWTYLRHYGFPSPLLDWSRSPYIASFFAFREQPPIPPQFVSIFVFLEYPHGQKTPSGKGPYITSLSKYQKSHPRHTIQQCEYTLCVSVKNEKYKFISHEEVFSNPPSGKSSQDLLWKFNIPYGERKKVLRYLDMSNLNAFSLFQAGEGLMETIANREFLLI